MSKHIVYFTDSDGVKRMAVHSALASKAETLRLLGITAAHSGWTDVHAFDYTDAADVYRRSNALMVERGEEPIYTQEHIDYAAGVAAKQRGETATEIFVHDGPPPETTAPAAAPVAQATKAALPPVADMGAAPALPPSGPSVKLTKADGDGDAGPPAPVAAIPPTPNPAAPVAAKPPASTTPAEQK